MSSLRHNIPKNYVFEFLKYSNVMHIFWFVYLLSRGFTVLEVALLESIFHITSLVFESPTGVIADLFGRKNTRILGIFFHITYLVGLWFASAYWIAVLAFMFAAISYNLESGSGTALIYDTLKEIGQEETFTKKESFREGLIRIASVVGNLAGGLLVMVSYQWAIGINIATYGIAILVALTFQETSVQQREIKEPFHFAFVQQYRESIGLFQKNTSLFFTMMTFALMSTITAILAYYATVYWESLSWSSFSIGFWFAVSGLCAALGAFISHKIEEKLSLRTILWSNVVLITLGFSFFFIPLVSIISFLLLSFLDGGLYVVMNALLNKKTKSEIRATVLSINSMFFSFLMVGLFPLFGWMVQEIDFLFSFLSFGLATFLLFWIFVPMTSFQKKKS